MKLEAVFCAWCVAVILVHTLPFVLLNLAYFVGVCAFLSLMI